MAERSKALDWNSSNILTGVPGFESLSLRQKKEAPHERGFVFLAACSPYSILNPCTAFSAIAFNASRSFCTSFFGIYTWNRTASTLVVVGRSIDELAPISTDTAPLDSNRISVTDSFIDDSLQRL
jgi:hypothetical protein